VQDIETAIVSATARIKSSAVPRVDMEASFSSLESSCTRLLQELSSRQRQQQQQQQEMERLGRIEQEMERERERRRHEEEARRREEEERSLKAEMEVRRRHEEEQQKRREVEQRKFREEMERQAELDREEAELRESSRLQEMRDSELARRIGGEEGGEGGGASPHPQPAPRTGSGWDLSQPSAERLQQQQQQHHDLRSWKYAELRDTINTSCDVPLLASCRAELHRRLRTFHAWRARNRARGGAGGQDPPRAPQSVMENAERLSHLRHHQEQGLESMSRVQTFYRIPFVVKGSAPGPSSGGAPRGWWLAHYDGSWLARQLELHPGKQPVLLVAGQDDERMCELRLEDTGLQRRRGAQILARRFEEAWQLSGGPTTCGGPCWPAGPGPRPPPPGSS
ncbi:unnamed protein product, partial [Lampetra fluviatilis]